MRLVRVDSICRGVGVLSKRKVLRKRIGVVAVEEEIKYFMINASTLRYFVIIKLEF